MATRHRTAETCANEWRKVKSGKIAKSQRQYDTISGSRCAAANLKQFAIGVQRLAFQNKKVSRMRIQSENEKNWKKKSDLIKIRKIGYRFLSIDQISMIRCDTVDEDAGREENDSTTAESNVLDLVAVEQVADHH